MSRLSSQLSAFPQPPVKPHSLGISRPGLPQSCSPPPVSCILKKGKPIRVGFEPEFQLSVAAGLRSGVPPFLVMACQSHTDGLNLFHVGSFLPWALATRAQHSGHSRFLAWRYPTSDGFLSVSLIWPGCLDPGVRVTWVQTLLVDWECTHILKPLHVHISSFVKCEV